MAKLIGRQSCHIKHITILKKIVFVTFESLTADSAGGIGRVSYDLCGYFHRKGYDVHFYCINKGPHTTPFPSSSVHWLTRYLLYALNKLFKVGLIDGTRRRIIEEYMMDAFLACKVLKGDLLLSTTPFLKRTLRKTKRQFKSFVLLPANPSETYISELYDREMSLCNVSGYKDAYNNPERLANFRAAMPSFDRVIALSAITAHSYNREGKPILQVPYIYIPDKKLEKAVAAKTLDTGGRRMKYLYLGHTVLLKGLHRLLQAWQDAKLEQADLLVVGHIDPVYMEKFGINFSKYNNVQYLGRVKDLDDTYSTADVVVIPSLIDNEPTVAIEALQHNVPVLISDQCGYSDFIGQAVPEAVFTLDNPDSLTEKLSYFYNNQVLFKARFLPAFTLVKEGGFDIGQFYKAVEHAINTAQ